MPIVDECEDCDRRWLRINKKLFTARGSRGANKGEEEEEQEEEEDYRYGPGALDFAIRF